MHKNIKILLACSILIHGGINLLAPIYALFIKNIGGTLIDASATIGAYAILKGILYFLFREQDQGWLSRKFMISGGYFLFGVGYVCYIFANKTIHIFGIQSLLAFAEVIINPSWSAVIANALTKGKERGIYSDFYGYRSIFEGLAAISGGFFAMYSGFNTLFVLMAVFAFGASFLSLFLSKD
ncbi:MAG: hypothetical protein HZA29_05195 [Candidatus Omnitrophica bacterium]|nr:hypothetical protein [Candidatus Omnitrophota bacterium]